MVGDLVHRHAEEVHEHQFGHRSQPAERGTDRRADDRRLSDRGVAHAVLTVLGRQPGGDLEHSPTRSIADVLAEQDYRVVGRHRAVQRSVYGLNQAQLLGVASGHAGMHLTGRRDLGAVGAEYIPMEFVGIGWRGGHCRSERLVQFGDSLGIDRVEVGDTGDALVDEALAVTRERRIGTHGGELFLVGIGHRVAEVVSLQAICDGLDERRPGPGACPLGCLRNGVVDCMRVGTVHGRPGHAVAGGPVGQSLGARVPAVRGAFGPEIVLTEEDHRQRPQRGHVHRLVDVPDAGGAVAEADQHDLPRLAQIRCQCDAVGDQRPGTDDPGGPGDTVRGVMDSHGAGLAPGQPVAAAEDLGEISAEVDALGQDVPETPVGGDELVAVSQCEHGACRHRLLAVHRPVAHRRLTGGQGLADTLVTVVDLAHQSVQRHRALPARRRDLGV